MNKHRSTEQTENFIWFPWRVIIRDRTDRLKDELRRISEKDTTNYEIAEDAVAAAREAAGVGDQPHSPRLSLISWITATAIESAWSSIHRAEEALLMIAADDVVRSEAVEMRAALVHWSPVDPRFSVYSHVLDTVIGECERLSTTQREALRGIRQTLNLESDSAQRSLRAFRNVLLVLAASLASVLVALAIIQAHQQSIFSLCPASGTSQTTPTGGCRTVSEVELVAGMGAMLSAVLFLGGLQGFRGAFGLPISQAILKIMAGVATGLLGVFLVQHAVLDILKPQDSDRILGYAALFGFAQQAVTQAVDSRASTLLGIARQTEAPVSQGKPSNPTQSTADK